MADACSVCHGSGETWDGGTRWTCYRCNRPRRALPARVRVDELVDPKDWPAWVAAHNIARHR